MVVKQHIVDLNYIYQLTKILPLILDQIHLLLMQLIIIDEISILDKHTLNANDIVLKRISSRNKKLGGKILSLGLI